MPRNMSFFFTKEQIINETKTVTRRNGWTFLTPFTPLTACEKCMGLKKGEKVKRLKKICVMDVRREPLNAITQDDVVKEGFPDWTPEQFVKFYCKHNKVKPDDLVTRIEFEYLPF